MKKFVSFITEARRTEKDVDSTEISDFLTAMAILVSKKKSNSRKAADVFHDYVKKGKFEDWAQKFAEPVWNKYGYPVIGSREWGKVEEEILNKYLRDK
jgi:hypothetical protein